MNAPDTARPVTQRDLERLKNLPVQADVWQLGLARMPLWVTDQGPTPFRPMVALCRSTAVHALGSGGLMAPGEPPAPAALEAIVELARSREIGYRPQRIEVRDPALVEALGFELAGAGITVALTQRLDALDEAIADMAEHFEHESGAPRFFDPALGIERLRVFAEAAVEFHRAAPWNHLKGEDLIRVVSPEPPTGLEWFSVLGSAHGEYGLGFYTSRRDFERFQTADMPKFYLGETRRWIFTYDEVTDWSVADSELWEEHDLPVADLHAYPTLACYVPQVGPVPANARELDFIVALLRSLATTTEDELDGGRWSKTVETFEGQRTIEFSLPGLLEEPSRTGRRGRQDRPALRDRRLMERTMADIQHLLAEQKFESVEETNEFLAAQVGKIPPHRAAQTPEERAQDLVYRALEAEGRLRIKLVREAIKLWPDCTEAWVVQAEEMPDPGRQVEFYRQAVAAGERALGPKPFAEDIGHFWGILQTRPYMRARNGLAGALWATGQRDEAITHWQGLLQLNPGDNQGVRDILVPRLIELRRDEEAETVLAVYPEDRSAMLSYARALIEYRRSGDGDAARAKLATAVQGNSHVIKYLTGATAMPEFLPESYRPGSEDEAQLAAAALAPAWQASENAVEWLRRSRRLRKKGLEEKRRRMKGRK